MNTAPKTLDAKSHTFRNDVTIEAETKILSELLRPNMRVLDVGCGATGRSALLMQSLGCEVHSIEINKEAIFEFSRKPESHGIKLTAADVRHIPYQNDSFDLVLVDFHCMDYLLDRDIRSLALYEMHRVMRDGGKLIFNGFNRIGILLNPRILRSRRYRRMWLRYVRRGHFFMHALVDENKLRLHQAIPVRII